jgi:hypothetical protein
MGDMLVNQDVNDGTRLMRIALAFLQFGNLRQ